MGKQSGTQAHVARRGDEVGAVVVVHRDAEGCDGPAFGHRATRGRGAIGGDVRAPIRAQAGFRPEAAERRRDQLQAERGGRGGGWLEGGGD